MMQLFLLSVHGLIFLFFNTRHFYIFIKHFISCGFVPVMLIPVPDQIYFTISILLTTVLFITLKLVIHVEFVLVYGVRL